MQFNSSQEKTIQAYPIDQESYFDLSWCLLDEYTYDEVEEFDCAHPTKTIWMVEDDRSIIEAHHYTESDALSQAVKLKTSSHRNRLVIVSCYNARDGGSYEINHTL